MFVEVCIIICHKAFQAIVKYFVRPNELNTTQVQDTETVINQARYTVVWKVFDPLLIS